MTKPEKRKHQHTLPNRQLAKAFRFSADDLASNRAGFITQAQLWAIPLSFRGIFTRIIDRFSLFARRPVADMICGRAHLSYQQQQIQSLFHADFIEVYKLSINHFEFRVTAQQYHALAEAMIYRLYYNAETKQILSLERTTNGC